MKKIVAIGLGIIVLLLGIPMSFQAVYRAQGTTGEKMVKQTSVSYDNEQGTEEFIVPVFRYELNEHQEIVLEEYLVGVVAAEMPASFELEALKAQAIAARTYTLRTLENEDFIYDTVMHQVFQDESQLRERWGSDFDYNYNRIRQAVEATKGLVVTHEGELIEPLFFAISNGKTENSEDFFPAASPYLRSVNSEWDKNGRGFEEEVSFNLTELRNAFNDSSLTFNSFVILSHTEGGNVQEVKVGKNILTGREFREKLELRSADFRFNPRDNRMYITTRGNGHGVGMSQTGANEMARMGKTFEDILNHYYQNIKIIEKYTLD